MSSALLATFTLAGHRFGVPVQAVQEVLRAQQLTPVPLAPPTIGGLMNLRGQVVTTIDLRRRIGLPAREDGVPAMNVVVRTDDGPVSLLVDDIGEVVPAPDDAFEPPPDTVTGVARELITGAYKLDGALLLALDVRRAVAA
jgi:purine-binding chemotaxis protein CheW